jgi:hypothetical protein
MPKGQKYKNQIWHFELLALWQFILLIKIEFEKS